MNVFKHGKKTVVEVDSCEFISAAMVAEICNKIDNAIIDELVKDFMKEYRNDILKKIDFKSIANAVGMRMVDKIMSNDAYPKTYYTKYT